MKSFRMAMVFLREVRSRRIPLGDVWFLIKGLLRGTLYIIWYRYLRRSALIRFPFMAYAPVRIVGKGRVFIEERCSVFYNLHEGLTIVTLSSEARVSIGKECDLGGLTIRSRHAVTLGDKVMTAACLIQDTMLADGLSFSRQADMYRNGTDGRTIAVGNHVWLSSMSTVLGGAWIGDESVLSVGSVAMGQERGVYRLLMGNPVRKSLSIDKLLKFKRQSCRK